MDLHREPAGTGMFAIADCLTLGVITGMLFWNGSGAMNSHNVKVNNAKQGIILYAPQHLLPGRLVIVLWSKQRIKKMTIANIDIHSLFYLPLWI